MSTVRSGWAFKSLISLACALGLAVSAVALPRVIDVARSGKVFGVGLERSDDGPATGSAEVVVAKLRPDGPLARAGVVPGDRVQLDPADVRLGYVDIRGSDVVRAGKQVRFRVVHAGRARTVAVRPELERYPSDALLVNCVAYALAPVLLGFALILAWRAPPSRANRALTLMLLARGLSTLPGGDLAQPSLPAIISGLTIGFGAVAFYFLAVFVVSFPQDHPRDRRRFVRRGLPAYALLVGAVGLFDALSWCGWSMRVLAPWALPVQVLVAAVPLLALVEGWRNSTGAVRERFRWIGLALFSLFGVPLVLGSGWTINGFLVGAVVQPAAVVIGAALLTYAVLRHRTVDLGFALNRAAVYAVTSMVLLVGFGLLEWAAERLLAFEGREENMALDAAVALGVFLTFHRVRDLVSEGIERIFFHHWRVREAALRGFVREAGFYARADALIAALHRALGDYLGDADVAVYLRDPSGALERATGTGAPRLEVDAPLSVRLRASPGVTVHDSPDVALAAPMVVGHELAGAVLVGARPDGSDYRPDEVELIGWAVERVGLALNVMRVRDLEAAVTRLEIRNEELSRVLREAWAPPGSASS